MGTKADRSGTPPVECSSRNSGLEHVDMARHPRESSAAGAVVSEDQHCDIKVDVHRKNSSDSSSTTGLDVDIIGSKVTDAKHDNQVKHLLIKNWISG